MPSKNQTPGTPPGPSARFVHYTPAVEREQPDEKQLIEQIVAKTLHMNRMTFDMHHRGLRGQHAKSHAVLRGTLTVFDGLPDYLRQGLFREPVRYDVIVRLSSAPGEVLADSISLPKGMAVKVLGVSGRERPEGEEDAATQDFLMTTGNSLAAGDVRRYLQANTFLEKHTQDSDALKQAASSLAQGADRVLNVFGLDSKALTGLGIRNTHLLGETYHTLAALRYGDYVAKLRVEPSSANLQPLRDRLIDADGHPSIHRDLIRDFFRENEAEFTVRAQLCTDLETMPVEDASVVWDEEKSPFLPVATLSFPVQDSYSPARRVFGDEVLSFSPWHCIEEHRPLGSIMRVRKQVYEASARFRHEMNVQPKREPRAIDELPD